MQKIQILEITQPYTPPQFDEEGNETQPAIPEVSHVFAEGNHAYEELLDVSLLESDEHEVIKYDKQGNPIPTRWQDLSEQEQVDEYATRRSIAYNLQLNQFKSKYPNKILGVKIVDV
jgi:hypothetical protein